jgi:hypothetical protein
MAELTDRQKEFVVAELATYHSPSEVALSFEQEFKIPLTRQQVANYDPTTVAGKKLGKEWKTLFEQYRQKFQTDRSTIAIAQQSFRLRALGELFDAQKSKSVKMALKVLEQAAKEEGGLYQRKADESGDDSGQSLSAEFDAAIDKIYKASDDDVPTEPREHASSPVP